MWMYVFALQVPEGVTVLMSASRSAYSKQNRVFQFSMEYPVPAYLVALVAGDLQHADIGPRYSCSIPSEKKVKARYQHMLFWRLLNAGLYQIGCLNEVTGKTTYVLYQHKGATLVNMVLRKNILVDQLNCMAMLVHQID